MSETGGEVKKEENAQEAAEKVVETSEPEGSPAKDESKVVENAEEAKPEENSDEAKSEENSDEAKPEENSDETKPENNSDETKAVENSDEAKPEEKVSEDKPVEGDAKKLDKDVKQQDIPELKIDDDEGRDQQDSDIMQIIKVETIQEEREEEEYEEAELEEEDSKIDREELIRQYVEAVAERESLTNRNSNAQHKLAEHFRKAKNLEQPGADVEKAGTDQDHSYVKALLQLEQLREKNLDDRDRYQKIIDEVKDLMKEKELYVEMENKQACTYKRNIASRSVYFRSGRVLEPELLTQLEMDDKIKEGEVSATRLENIKLKNKLAKLEAALRKKEELAEGLHLIDFEQLKIENQTYNEKIEERNEELLKLRKKITDTVQVLTHLKEKMQFIQGENLGTKAHLMHIESKVARKRDVLSRTKNARDVVRNTNTKLRQKSGLLGKPDLLLDYDHSYTLQSDLRHKVETLKRQHAELSLNIKGVKQKIDLVPQ